MAPHLALYRKYRSASFADVIGQEHVTEPLMQALERGRINHAYLFSGPRGCGKTSSARILARSLNCASGPTPNPCGVCDSCVELAPNGPGSIDVIEIDAASHGGVDDARDLRERAFYAPVRDRYKVYIVDEAHMVSTQGFNALLKLVEEPPEFLVFVFATTEPDKVLQTIRSRTHHYPFRLIPPSAMRAHLEKICQTEQIAVEPAVLPLVVRAGGGSARDSLSLLDQLLAGAGDGGVTYARAVALLGVTDAALLDTMVDALAAYDSAAAYGAINSVVEAGHDPRRFAGDLLDRFRDLMLIDAVPDAAVRHLVDVTLEDAETLAKQASLIGTASIARFAEIVHNALVEMRGATSARLVLELLCARMLLPDASADSAALLQRVERLERRMTAAPAAMAPATTAPAVTAPKVAAPKVAAPKVAAPKVAAPVAARPAAVAMPEAVAKPEAVAMPAASPKASPVAAQATAVPASQDVQFDPAQTSAAAPGAIDSVAMRQLWPAVLDRVKQRSRRTRALLDNAQVGSVTGNEVHLLASSATLAKMIGDDSNIEQLRAALTDEVGGQWLVKVGVDGSAGTPSTAAEMDEAMPSVPRGDQDSADPQSESDSPALRADPETEALQLLRSALDARPLD